MRQRWRAAAGAVTWVLAGSVLAGCTGDASPTVTPGATTSPTIATPLEPTESTAPPEVTAPVRPEAMETAGPDGAAAAASYFISLYGYASVTGDLAEWIAMSSPECTFCSNVRAEVERVATAGGRTEGGEVTIHSATGAEVTEGQWYSAKLDVSIAPSRELAEDGAVVAEDDGGDYVVDLALSWSGAWLIDAVGITPTGAGT